MEKRKKHCLQESQGKSSESGGWSSHPPVLGRGNFFHLNAYNTEITNIKDTVRMRHNTIRCKIIHSHPCHTQAVTHTL